MSLSAVLGKDLISSHENVIAILDIIVPSNYANFTEVYLVQVSYSILAFVPVADDQELMETDL